MSGNEDHGFLQRWSRRKTQVQRGLAGPEPAAPAAVPPATSAVVVPATAAVPATASPSPPPATSPPPAQPQAERPPAPTMEDVSRLTRDSDYSRFIGSGVDPAVSNAAMRKLFRDPHFNVMDGLDVYIDDYGKPDPIPESMLRQLNQSKLLRLFETEEKAAAEAAAAAASTDGEASPTVAQSVTSSPESPPRIDDDPDLRLQQDDAPGRPGPEPDPRA